MTAAASGQRERVKQLMPTALPRIARLSPMAPLTKFSTVSPTGTAEGMRNNAMKPVAWRISEVITFALKRSWCSGLIAEYRNQQGLPQLIEGGKLFDWEWQRITCRIALIQNGCVRSLLKTSALSKSMSHRVVRKNRVSRL